MEARNVDRFNLDDHEQEVEKQYQEGGHHSKKPKEKHTDHYLEIGGGDDH